MQIKVLQADSTHAQALSELGIKTFCDTFGDDNPPDDLNEFLNSTYTPEIQEIELKDPFIYTYMAFDSESKPVAFCQMKTNGKVYDFVGDADAIELARIYVDKRCVGQGVGKKLMDTCFSKARELGKKTIWLGVWEENTNAIEFYKKHGFRKVGSHTFKIGNKIDTDDVMAKSL
ncbi:acyl-CoA N-acyltransferase [Blakeslea trispora]|nr:acyl-CoA N-acyltransferase [Blakeslea trispora]